MDQKLKDLIESGDAALEKILDGVHHVRDLATGKVYEWADGPIGEVQEIQQKVAPTVVSGNDKLEHARQLAKKRGLFL